MASDLGYKDVRCAHDGRFLVHDPLGVFESGYSASVEGEALSGEAAQAVEPRGLPRRSRPGARPEKCEETHSCRRGAGVPARAP
jgi:hypothetical protein